MEHSRPHKDAISGPDPQCVVFGGFSLGGVWGGGGGEGGRGHLCFNG